MGARDGARARGGELIAKGLSNREIAEVLLNHRGSRAEPPRESFREAGASERRGARRRGERPPALRAELERLRVPLAEEPHAPETPESPEAREATS